MHIQFVSNKSPLLAAGPVSTITPVYEGNKPGDAARNGQAGSVLQYISQIQSEFKGKASQVLFTTPPYAENKQVFLGMGDSKKLDESSVQKTGAKLYKELTAQGVKNVVINIDRTSDTALDNAAIAANLADALLRQSYSFDKYKSGLVPDKEPKKKVDTVTIIVDDPEAAKKAFAPLRAVTEGSFLAADLSNEPPNVLYPETYAERIEKTLAPLGVRVRVLGPQEIKDMDMNGVWNVGKGSEHLPFTVLMEYDGTEGRQEKPLVLDGKGVTFDTGGISIKPGLNMDEMKHDMGGSAAVVGAIYAAAVRGAKAHIVGIVPLAENTPSHTAYRPGDIIKTMSGITVHVGNTDAEGRMILCDTYTLSQHLGKDPLIISCKPAQMPPGTVPSGIFSLATLTGAQVTATGDERAAVFSNDDSLAAKFKAAGEAAGELCQPMPLGQEYADAMRHKHADLSNISSGSKTGSSTAAEFLHFFIEKNEDGSDKYPWVHIDMAGPGIKHPGWGVRLLDQVIRDHYEEKPQKPGISPSLDSPLLA